jgi:ATP-binding cassette, subfamily B, bacterial CvaB/MchF/RaxB
VIDLGLFTRRRISFVAANEINECGLACLASISEYFQGEQTLIDVRRLAAHGGRGETLLEIRNIAERMGLAARGVRLEPGGLKVLAKPAILHWDMNHFVVLDRVTRNGVIIMDPAVGRVEIKWTQVNTSFTGVALEVKPTERWQLRTHQPRRVSVFSFLRPFAAWRTDATLIIALSLLLEVFVLLGPLQLQISVDDAVQVSDRKLVWVLGLGFALVMLIQASISVVRAWSMAVFGARLGFELRDRFVRALHRKPAGFFLKYHTADILNRARSVDTIQTLITGQLLQAVLDATMSVALVVLMFVVSPVMAAVVVGFGVLNLGLTASLRHAAIDNSRRNLRVAAKADALFLENARAARAIRLFGKESVRTGVWRNKFVELMNVALSGGRLVTFSMQSSQLTGNMSNVALISTGAYLVISNSITLGTMMMFVLFRAFFVERLNSCANYLMDLRRVQSHAERIDDVMSANDGSAEEGSYEPYVVPPHQGVGIEVRDLWFRYGNESPWIFKGLSLKVEPGESVAITGPSGCGKTTLMNLLLGLLVPERGEVLVNGRDLRTISSFDYAKLLGVVMQDDILFHGTVAENISFFDAPLDMVRVQKAAEMANIARDIEAMPMHYYSLLAESAANISGGQKQRLFIARAVYHGPKILFLDEATSHLDTESERLVSQAVKSMQLTRVLVAHRRETIATADRIINLDHTCVAPEGLAISRSHAYSTTAVRTYNSERR